MTADPSWVDSPVIREARERAERRRVWLKSDAAREQRRESRSRFRGLKGAEAIRTVREALPDTFDARPWTGLELNPGDRLEGYVGRYGAKVKRAGATRPTLVESTLPLLAGESRRPVDLTIRPDGDGFAPANAPVEMRFPKDLAEGLTLPDVGVKVTPAGASASAVGDPGRSLLWSNVDTDTDFGVVPSPSGFQTFHALRSPASPETLKLNLGLPSGATLRPVTKGKGDIGVGFDVVRGDKVIARVHPPTATDAQGQSVPVSMEEVTGGDLSLKVPHRDRALAYPIAVDPLFEDQGTFGTNNQAGWQFLSSHGGFGSNHTGHRGDGRYLILNGSFYYHGDFAWWRYQAPGNSRITGVQWNNARAVQYNAKACTGLGIYRAGNDGAVNPPQDFWGYCSYDFDYPVTPPPQSTSGTPGNQAIFNFVALGDYWRGSGWAYVGGAQLTLEDDYPPFSYQAPTHQNLPGGWTHRATPEVTPHIQDDGLGVKRLAIRYPTNGGGPGQKDYVHGCTGTAASRCPGQLSQPLGYATDDLPEGANELTAHGWDVLERTVASPPTWTVRVDRTAPVQELSGTLTSAENRAVAPGTRSLTIKGVDDPPGGSAGAATSGVKTVGYRIRAGADGSGAVVASDEAANPDCNATTGCSKNFQPDAFSVDLDQPDGRYVAEVYTNDQLGDDSTYGSQHTVVKRIPFEVEGSAPQASVSVAPSGWLKDGSSLTASVTGDDGSGSGIKSFALRYPDGSSPAAIDRECGGLESGGTPPRCQSPDTAAFPAVEVASDRFPQEGRVKLSGRVTDAAGNESAWADGDARIDRSAPELTLGGSLYLTGGTLLFLDEYTLTYQGKDGSTSSAAAERSGMKRVRVFAKKDAPGAEFVEKHDSGERACAEGSCELNGSYQFRTDEYDANSRYTIRVVATDQLGHEKTEQFDVNVGETLGAPTVEARNGLEEFWNYDSTETGVGTRGHVNLQTGNFVWHWVPLVDEGRGLSAVANVTYNSQETFEEAIRPESWIGDSLGQYNTIGRGFSLGISGLTRVNEPLDFSQTGKVRLTDVDGTRHEFVSEDGCKTFTKPAGVHLRLRRYSPPSLMTEHGCELATVTGGPIQDPNRAWAATRPDGVTHFFDARGFQTGIEDRNGNRIEFDYEFRSVTGDQCTLANSDGVTAAGTVVDPSLCPRRLVAVRDAEDLATPGSGQAVSLTYHADDPSEPGIDASRLVKEVTDRAGRVLFFDYEDGALKTVTQAKGTNVERKFGFGYAGDLSTPGLRRRPVDSITDSRNATSTMAYASDGGLGGIGDGIISRNRVTEVTNRLSRSRAFTYAREGQDEAAIDTATVTDALNREWKHRMDSAGRPLRLTKPAVAGQAGTATELEWDPDINAVTKVTAAAGTTEAAEAAMTYNQNGLLTGETTKPGNGKPDRTRTLRYRNGAGVHLSGVVDDSGGDFVSDLDLITNPKPGTGWSFGLDARGNVTSRTDAEGRSATTAYDSAGRITSETDEQSNLTKYSDFHRSGQPRVRIDPRATEQGETDSDHRWIYRYDVVGNLIRATDPRGARAGGVEDERDDFTTRLSYDALDRLDVESVPKDTEGGASSRIFRDRDHDPNDNVTRSEDGEGHATTVEYTAMDKPEVVTAPGSNGSEVTRYGYDELDQLTSKRDPKSSGTGLAFATEYKLDEVGRRVADVRHSPGAPGGQDRLVTSYAFDRRDNVVGVIDAKRNDSRTPDQAITAVKTPANRRQNMSYNGVDEVIASVEQPTGDPASVRQIKRAFDYDENGNRTSETSPRKDGDNAGVTSNWETAYEFDHRDQLTSVTNPAGEKTIHTRREDGKVVATTSPRGAGQNDDQDVTGSSVKARKEFTTRYDYNRNGELIARSVPFRSGQYGRSDSELAGWKVRYARNEVGDPTEITDARGNSFDNEFYDTGDISSTERPSWWGLDWGEGTGGAGCRCPVRWAGRR